MKIPTSNANCYFWLIVASCVVFLCHLMTVENYPPTWYDEVCMIEWGRFSFFDIAPKWAVDLWKSPDGIKPPYPYFHYLAGAVYEGLFRLTGHFLAARIWTLSSLLVVPVFMFRWLTKSYDVRPLAAFLVSLLLLVDPNVTICAHWYRPDIWSIIIFLIFTAIIRRINKPMVAAVFIGFAIAVNTAFWITSILFAPLYLYEFYLWTAKHRSGLKEIWFRSGIFCAVGFLVTAAIILIPQYGVLPSLIDQYAHRSELGSMANATSGLSVVLRRAFDFLMIALRSPFIWLLAGLYLLFSRRLIFHKIVFVGLVILMLLTRVYHLRMIYLVPFLYIFAASTIAKIEDCECRRKLRAIVAFAIAVYTFISVPLLNVAAYPKSNTFAVFKDRLNTALGTIKGDVYIIDFEHECYFALRETGRNPICCTNAKTLFDPDVSEELLSRINAVVVSNLTPLDEPEINFLSCHGFKKTASFELPPDTSPGVLQTIRSVVYAHGFPGCSVFTRIECSPIQH